MTGLAHFRLLRMWLLFTLAAILYCTPAIAKDTLVLRRGGAGDPESLDPHNYLNAFESTILTDLFIGLTTTSSTDTSVPGSAKSWTISDDGLTYTFVLREELVWSDGVAIDAYDFEWSFRHLMDPKTAFSFADYFYPVVNGEAISRGQMPLETLGVKALDDRTVEIRLQHPAPYLMDILSINGKLVPRHVLKKHGSAWSRPENMVTNGPYMLDDWIPSTHVKLIKNPKFYDAENVRLEEIYHIPSENMNTGFKRFRAGELDTLVFFPPEQLDWIKLNMPDVLHLTPGLSVELYLFNTEHPPFDDVRVRLALSMAIDRETLVERVMRTGEIPAYGYVPPTINNYPVSAKAKFKDLPYETRLKQARALLAESGFSPQNPLLVPLRYNTQDLQRRMAIAIAAMWKRIGVEVELINTERKVLSADRKQGNFSVARWLRVGATYDPTSFLIHFHSDLSGLNLSRYNDVVYDKLFETAWFSRDIDDRAARMLEAEEHVINDHPAIPLYFYTGRRLVQTYVKGWIDNARGVYPSRWLWIEE